MTLKTLQSFKVVSRGHQKKTKILGDSQRHGKLLNVQTMLQISPLCSQKLSNLSGCFKYFKKLYKCLLRHFSNFKKLWFPFGDSKQFFFMTSNIFGDFSIVINTWFLSKSTIPLIFYIFKMLFPSKLSSLTFSDVSPFLLSIFLLFTPFQFNFNLNFLLNCKFMSLSFFDTFQTKEFPRHFLLFILVYFSSKSFIFQPLLEKKI